MSELSRRSIARSFGCRGILGAVLASVVFPAPALAFYQRTSLEGNVGGEVSGVWLSVQQIMPEFRINFPKPSEGRIVPFQVAAVPAELGPVVGPKSVGVAVAECVDERLCVDYGILVGDIVLKVNSIETPTPETFEATLESVPQTVSLSIRRPALKMTTARLLKIRHEATVEEIPGASTSVAKETMDLRVLDVSLPFAAELEATRQSHDLLHPSAEQLEKLAETWFDLPGTEPRQFINGSHRFVARSAFDESLSADPALAESKHAIVLDLEGNPIRGGGGKVIDIFGVESLDAKTMEGTYITATIATAPFPINVEFKGRFRMTRLADWSDQDDRLRAERAASRKPAEDLGKYELAPDVPKAAGGD
jgi:hypothetical protein